ncbi:hypothetical protein ACFV1F_19785 [Streptomyces sp. NPDC059590]|uniref:hypothetical protein n=1 Tax=Streptomyces sp. NPDC059590 TaxID=3346877 RepID=UPI003679FB49
MGSHRLRRRPLALLCAWGALALATPALADSSDPPRHAHDRTQAALDRIVAQGTPGVIARHLLNHTSGISRLLRGELLPAAQQRRLLTAVSVAGDKGHGGEDDLYGLGIRRFKLDGDGDGDGDGDRDGDCWAWGHGGMIPGSGTRTVVSGDGRHAMTMNRNGDWGEQKLEDAAVIAEFFR